MPRLLIVIDMQEGWRHKTATEATMLRVVELAKEFDGDIIHCRFKNDPESLFYSQIHWREFMEPHHTDEIPEIAPLGLTSYWRSTYSCLTDEVSALLGKYDHIYIAGVYTDVSVYTTALNIFDLNIPVSVVSDCVATLHGDEVHEGALRSLRLAIGDDHVIPAHDLGDALR